MQLLNELHTGTRHDNACLIMEHHPVFTLGRNASPENITVSKEFLQQHAIEVIRAERGGEVTYHGPGQLICYPIIAIRRIHMGIAQYIEILEQIMIDVSCYFGLEVNRDKRNHGIWKSDRKLGSVGIAVRHGISYHGMALNVNLDLNPFSWINPCGLKGVGMGSMKNELQQSLNMDTVKTIMIEKITDAFAGNMKYSPPVIRKAKPKWLKRRLPTGSGYEKTRRRISCRGLHTVCQEARCPNQFECFGKGTATFMLMGENCTRNCRFCAVGHSKTTPLDSLEPQRVASAVKDMGLSYAVLTSVTRDDLEDGGAAHFAQTIDAIRHHCPETLVEVLIPDLQGNEDDLAVICEHGPSALNHNVETVAGLYPEVRPQAVYVRSLELLRRTKKNHPGMITKSGIMLGLGETQQELQKTLADIRETGCDLLTLGQYLQPTKDHLVVQRYVPPEEFDMIRSYALELGFSGVAAGPHVRSSYNAEELYNLAFVKSTDS